MIAQLREESPRSFLDVVETYNQESASVHALFGSETSDGSRSVSASRRAADVRWNDRLLKFAEVLSKVQSGRLPNWVLKEAMTTADFPLLFGDVIDRAILANYQATNNTWRNYCHYSTVADFRTVHRFAMNGSESLLPTVAQNNEYPESALSDLQYSYQIGKYGRRVPFAWEAMINDDLNGLKDIPARLGRAAARTEEYFATSLFVSSSGPNSTFFSDSNKNKVDTTNGASSTNPALSIGGLQDAMLVLANQRDVDGQPIFIDAVELVVPPALEVTANNILHADNLWLGGFGQSPSGPNGGGTQSQMLMVANWMRNRMRLNVNYYLPYIDTTHGNTSWYLFASPDATRPAIEIGHLRGHESPETFVKAPTSMRVGGGAADPMDGDFDTDSIVYKIRHVMGGVLMDPRMAVASNGSGS